MKKEDIKASVRKLRETNPKITIKKMASRLDQEESTIFGVVQELQDEGSDRLRDQIRGLQREVKKLKKEKATDDEIRSKIFEIKEHEPSPPPFLTDLPNKAQKGMAGVPVLVRCDEHYGEVVDPNQVHGWNEFNTTIAENRIRRLTSKTIDLIQNHVVSSGFPGIVIPHLGDNFSGDIHEELTATNESAFMPLFLDYQDIKVWEIRQYADAFGQVFIPWVTGNHSRTTKRPPYKDRNYTNYDWLLGMQLAKIFEDDPRVTFAVSGAIDYNFKIYNWTFNATHGDKFRGGNGIMGCLSSIIWGDAKKRRQYNQLKQPYDYLLCGHFHYHAWVAEGLVCGSSKGFDELCLANEWQYCEPCQTLFLVHPEYGISHVWKVILGKRANHDVSENSWVSLPAGA